MQKEEQILFPMMKAHGNDSASEPIAMLRSEHVDHGAALEHLLGLAQDTVPPEGACNTWCALYAGIAQLNEDLINHIHLENNVLFPAFESTAAPAKSGCGGGGHGCGCQ